ncbi:MAG: hypothetical protein M3Z00_07700 [Actinomycetota bacterium]|nr:hypothetical protein [Actinomycetota bacterium]
MLPAADDMAADAPADDGAAADEPADDGAAADEPADDGAAADKPADDGAAADEPAEAALAATEAGALCEVAVVGDELHAASVSAAAATAAPATMDLPLANIGDSSLEGTCAMKGAQLVQVRGSGNRRGHSRTVAPLPHGRPVRADHVYCV